MREQTDQTNVPAAPAVLPEGVASLKVVQTKGGTLGLQDPTAVDTKTVAEVNPDTKTIKTGPVIKHDVYKMNIPYPQ